jgi:hypothetical protein
VGEIDNEINRYKKVERVREREKRFEKKIEAKTGSAERNVQRMRIETRDEGACLMHGMEW